MDAELASSGGAAPKLTPAQIRQLMSELSVSGAVRGPQYPPDTVVPLKFCGRLQPSDLLMVHHERDLSGVPGCGDVDHYGIYVDDDWRGHGMSGGPTVVHFCKLTLSSSCLYPAVRCGVQHGCPTASWRLTFLLRLVADLLHDCVHPTSLVATNHPARDRSGLGRTPLQVQVTTFDRFVGNNGKQNVFVVKPANSSPSSVVLTRALLSVGQLSYNLWFFNCEHCELSADYITGGRRPAALGLTADMTHGGTAALLTHASLSTRW